MPANAIVTLAAGMCFNQVRRCDIKHIQLSLPFISCCAGQFDLLSHALSEGAGHAGHTFA